MPGMEVYGAEERKEVMDVLETGVLFRYGHEHLRKGMWKAAEFEAEVCKQTGANYALGVSSGTASFKGRHTIERNRYDQEFKNRVTAQFFPCTRQRHDTVNHTAP